VNQRPTASPQSPQGEGAGALRVRLSAPPVDDRAMALCVALAARLKVPVNAVKIVVGERSRTKGIEIRGATAVEIRALDAGATRQMPATTEK
jgi:uncharacterized protein